MTPVNRYVLSLAVTAIAFTFTYLSNAVHASQEAIIAGLIVTACSLLSSTALALQISPLVSSVIRSVITLVLGIVVFYSFGGLATLYGQAVVNSPPQSKAFVTGAFFAICFYLGAIVSLHFCLAALVSLVGRGAVALRRSISGRR